MNSLIRRSAPIASSASWRALSLLLSPASWRALSLLLSPASSPPLDSTKPESWDFLVGGRSTSRPYRLDSGLQTSPVRSTRSTSYMKTPPKQGGDEGLEVAKLAIAKDIIDRLARKGITKLFPIQRAVLEPAMQGRDMIGRARTGTGKTLAFGIPIIDNIIRFQKTHGLVILTKS